MRIKIILFFLLLGSLFRVYSSTTDSIIISGRLKNNVRFSSVAMIQFSAGESIVAQTSIVNEHFSISVPKTIEKGVYRLSFSRVEHNRFVDVILSGEEKISFEVDVSMEKFYPIFSESQQNTDWYAYQFSTDNMLHKIAVLGQFIANYPAKNDDVLKTVKSSYEKEKKNLEFSYKDFINKHGLTWAGLMVKNRSFWFPNPEDLPQIQSFEIREHLWDEVDTNSIELLNTPLYTELILEYLRFYMNPEYSEKEVNDGFKKSVDEIMTRFGNNQVIKKFVLDYLTRGFNEIGQEVMLQYLDENYRTAASCESDQEKSEFEKRLKAYALLKPGMSAPKIEFSDSKGNLKGLDDFESEQIVLVFWASWCTHCMEMLPKLKEEMAKHSNVQVVAISLDDNPSAYLNAVKGYESMFHYCDYGKWDSKPVKDYHVVATPTFFLLDKQRIIVNKFSDVRTLFSALATK